ncbi:MAG: glutamate-5-semialdehyde dehydrogenase [Clostridia bacterium]|nr:glutamate-5-semialdehyde dehydrogenase [Clostridia bacterium]
MTTLEILKVTKSAWRDLNRADTETKNKILNAMADSLVESTEEIISQNAVDMENARGKISDVMLDRLMLDEKRIEAMAQGIRDIAKLPDPTGEILTETARPNGMTIYKKRVPIGVVAIIYESRPNVTSDAAALSVKSGNVCVLRGGKEAFNTSNAIVNALKIGIEKAGINPEIINLVQDTTRQSATELMKANGLVDLLIPRGGAGLIRACVENATVPCIQTGTGICHIYIDEFADLEKAITIVNNAKTSRPSVCNAAEVCLVHKNVADKFLPILKSKLVDERKAYNLIPVELRLDEKSAKIIEGTPTGENDFDTEFLDYILAVKVVENVDEAISHILAHSTGHSEGIVTENEAVAEKFVAETDSAAVYVNVSTRFTDGGEFGLGCEMGISTQKLHARGPMGIEELTTYKYIIKGNGQVR